MKGGRLILAALLAVSSAGVNAQSNTSNGYGTYERLQLVSANVATPASRVLGGNYLFSQICTGYGTVALQVMWADGSTYVTQISKTATETTSSPIQLGAGSTVKVVLTGTTACNAVLARVPA